MASKAIYLDYAAATPLDEKVFAVMKPYFAEKFFNPSAAYQPARDVKNDIEQARHQISQIIGRRSSEIIFTAGATESINLAFTVDGHIITSAVEHAAIIEAAKNHARGSSILPVNKSGKLSLKEIENAMEYNTRLISVGLINNETGALQDLKEIHKLIQKERGEREKEKNPNPIYLHVDASQAAGITDLHVARLGVDMMTLNAGKIYGPKQVGMLYAHNSIKLWPIVKGGGQERGLRSGTENVAGIVGFAKALEIAEKKRKDEYSRLQGLKDQITKVLLSEFEDIQIISPKHSAPHILSVSWSGIDAERILFALENQGVLVATGSACAANKDTRSHVLEALGLPSETIDGSIRLSFGRHTTPEHIKEAGKIIVMVVKKELQRVSRN